MSELVTLRNLNADLSARMAALRVDRSAVLSSREIVDRAVDHHDIVYGVNTGFGALARVRIEESRLAELQRNLLMSHAVGVGELIPRDICRLMLRLKIHSLGLGNSGISISTFDRLLEFDRLDAIPASPSRGSVGASGDLAPLAHMSLPLIGFGQFWDAHGVDLIPASRLLAEFGLEPLELKAKDGLSLINGTQMMTAYGAYVLEQTLRLGQIADIAAAMSLEALQGSIVPFDSRIQEMRPHPGQSEAAANVRALVAGSEIMESHRHCGKVQDPYSLRCVPQVHGASRDALRHVAEVVQIEVNSTTDNPVVATDGVILSGGNFHGQPIALALDYAAMAIAEFASISERRIYLLLSGDSGLPPLLMRETGINSGFMIPQYTAAALVSENKVLCHPASVDSIPTSLGQEDHVSMGSISATKLLDVFRNVERVLSIELLTAAQALDFRLPLRPGRGVEVAHQLVREYIPHRERDYLFDEDFSRCLELIRTTDLQNAVAAQKAPLI